MTRLFNIFLFSDNFLGPGVYLGGVVPTRTPIQHSMAVLTRMCDAAVHIVYAPTPNGYPESLALSSHRLRGLERDLCHPACSASMPMMQAAMVLIVVTRGGNSHNIESYVFLRETLLRHSAHSNLDVLFACLL